MSGTVNALVAGEHVADLRRAVARPNEAAGPAVRRKPATVELRLADAGEAGVVRRLASLDDAPELEGPVLLALLDGDAVAGLSLHDRRVVANPFVAADEAVALLRLRAEHMSGASARRRRRRRWGLRFA
jgi:hypothetical protein